MVDRRLFVPIGLCAVGGFAAWHFWDPAYALKVDKQDALRQTMNTFASIDATMLGFLVATGALVFAIAQTTLVRNMYRTNHVQRLLAALFFDAALFLVALVIGMAGSLADKPEVVLLRWLVCFNAAALVGLVIVGRTMWHLLLNAGPRPGTPLEFP